MKAVKLLIADKDSAYVQAMVNYLIGSGVNYEVTGYTKVELFLQEEGIFQLALLGEGFIEEVGHTKMKLGHVLFLTGDIQKEREGYQPIYKFQMMGDFIRQLQKNLKTPVTQATPAGRKDQRNICIYSPMHHELALPFALSMSRILAEQGQTLLVDMEEISLLPELLERSPNRDLGDYLYYLSSGGKETGSDITDFLGYYEGFYYLAPLQGIGAVADVKEEDWCRLFEQLSREEFTQILWLMDAQIQGMPQILERVSEILLLGKPGDYYVRSQKKFLEQLVEAGLEEKVHAMMLPMSAGNLTSGGYHMSQLLNGNLGGYVRKEYLGGA
ncbi:MAG: hypothetical protein IIU28_04165 [Lachnospiraceae bacterium]|nr:hypothetical protein [Lachnospiraceae bacterium]